MSSQEPKFPFIEVEVELTGPSGNAFSILGRVQHAMKRAGIPKDVRDEYFEKATQGSYESLLEETERWVKLVYVDDADN